MANRNGPGFGLFVVAMGIGAGLAYFLDPNRGARRRNMTRDQLTSAVGQGASQLSQAGRYAGSAVSGAVQQNPPDNPNPDDKTLKDRILSEAFRGRNMNKEDVVVNVADGVVELRGELQTQGDIDSLIAEVKSVPGVREIVSYLHLPNTPAPNKESVLRVS